MIANSCSRRLQPAATLVDEAKRRRELDEERYARGDVDMEYREWLEEMDRRASLYGVERRDDGNVTLGYVTSDSCPGVGDDIPHTPLPFFPTPDYTGSDAPTGLTDDTLVDLVFDNFTQDDLLTALNALQGERVYTCGCTTIRGCAREGRLGNIRSEVLELMCGDNIVVDRMRG